MLLNLFNVIYVLVAIAMIVLILLQRGAGAQAGSGFGSGASATVFGARGAANFLSRSTAVLAGLFFLLSLAMGIYLGHSGVTRPADDLGVMGAAPEPKPAAPTPAPAASSDVPQAPASGAPASDQTTSDKPTAPAAAPASDKPAAPAAAAPATPVKSDAAPKSDAAAKKKSDQPKGK
jgi:preprotein translocase subunit SecG